MYKTIAESIRKIVSGIRVLGVMPEIRIPKNIFQMFGYLPNFSSLYRYGNTLLIQSIDQLVDDLENKDCSNQQQLKKIRPDADLVHNDGFYLFNIQVHRVMILIEFEDDGEATIVWCGSHDEYETTFKNNKSTIRKWLNNQGLIN
jgi:mRNA-degrading endonuclease HigB of HigAB toxin-antitoxin module